MGLLRRGQEMLTRRLTESDGGAVTYGRTVDGVAREATLTARVGRTLFSGLHQSAVGVRWGERDYLIEVADLVLPGLGATTPMDGDRIADADGVWVLAAPQSGEPSWRYSDQFRTVFRVHCKRAA